MFLYDGFFQNTSHCRKNRSHTRFPRVSSVFSDSRSRSSVSSALAADKSQKTLCKKPLENKSHAHFHWKWISISSSSSSSFYSHFHSPPALVLPSSWFLGPASLIVEHYESAAPLKTLIKLPPWHMCVLCVLCVCCVCVPLHHNISIQTACEQL